MKLVCGLNLFASHDLETALKSISKIGFEYVDLWSSPALSNQIDPEKDSPEKVKSLLKKYNLTAVSFTIYLTNDEQRKARLQWASEMEIPLVIWEPAPSIDWPDNMKLGEKAINYGTHEDSFNQYLEKIKKDLELAKRLGVKISLEVPHCYTHSEHLHEIRMLHKNIKDDHLGYTLAPPHAIARGYTIEEAAEAVEMPNVDMLYLWDVKEGFSYPEDDRAFGGGEQQLPGGGSIDFASLIENFERNDFKGWYTIKCHGTEPWKDLQKVEKHVQKSFDHISNILQNKKQSLNARN